jgi:hypothetical protein
LAPHIPTPTGMDYLRRATVGRATGEGQYKVNQGCGDAPNRMQPKDPMQHTPTKCPQMYSWDKMGLSLYHLQQQQPAMTKVCEVFKSFAIKIIYLTITN